MQGIEYQRFSPRRQSARSGASAGRGCCFAGQSGGAGTLRDIWYLISRQRGDSWQAGNAGKSDVRHSRRRSDGCGDPRPARASSGGHARKFAARQRVSRSTCRGFNYPGVTVWTARLGERIACVAALKMLAPEHGEVKINARTIRISPDRARAQPFSTTSSRWHAREGWRGSAWRRVQDRRLKPR